MTDLRSLQLVDEAGCVDAEGGAWLRSASIDERRLLARAAGPVLDVGCGPGRHVRALQALGVDVLGIDVTPSMLETATGRGAPVVAASVFDPLPRMGQWRTALLLDGNSGLGGHPVGLLRRLRDVLRPGGRVLADLVTGSPTPLRRLRLRHGRRLGPSFGWAPLHADDLDGVARAAGFEILDQWKIEERWFCELRSTRTRSLARPITEFASSPSTASGHRQLIPTGPQGQRGHRNAIAPRRSPRRVWVDM